MGTLGKLQVNNTKTGKDAINILKVNYHEEYCSHFLTLGGRFEHTSAFLPGQSKINHVLVSASTNVSFSMYTFIAK